MSLLSNTLDIEWPFLISYPYINEWPALSWISKATNNKAIQSTPWTICREEHIRWLKNQFTELVFNVDKTRFALKKTYLKTGVSPKKWARIVSYDDKSMVTAMRILNLIENEVGWSLTTITKINIEQIKPDFFKTVAYLITGSTKWIKAIPLISLYLLIIRSCWFTEFYSIKRIEDIKTVCEKLTKKVATTVKQQKDITNISNSYKYWLLLIINTKFMFEKRSHRLLYKKNGSAMGITELVQKSKYIDPTTINRWKKLLAKGTS